VKLNVAALVIVVCLFVTAAILIQMGARFNQEAGALLVLCGLFAASLNVAIAEAFKSLTERLNLAKWSSARPTTFMIWGAAVALLGAVLFFS
jgi:hypothetical protein